MRPSLVFLRALAALTLLFVPGACGGEGRADEGRADESDAGVADAGSRPRDPLRMRIELPPLDCSRDNCFQFVVLSDPHVIDEWYMGPESNMLDTESLQLANERLVATRDRIHALGIELDHAFVLGDIVHEYNSPDTDFYYDAANRTAHDIVAEILERFEMPVHLALGNHDYAVPELSREFTQQLFRDKLGLEQSYYAIDHRGFRLIVLDSQLGETWDPASPRYDKGVGSLGEAQLRWLDAQLAEGLPSFVMMHHHPISIARDELDDPDFADVLAVLERHAETVRMVFSGHMHRWFNHRQTYGAWHLTVGATRYDEDSFLVVRCDVESGEFDLLNPETPVWGSVNSMTFAP